MDATGEVICLSLLFVCALVIGWWWWQLRRIRHAKSWPSTEATIQSGGIEVVTSSRYGSIRLPAFSFSYKVDGEYYSGRFALRPDTTEPVESLIKRLIDSKLQVRYDPCRPSTWFIPDELIEGCRIEQKMGPHLIGLYPKE